MEFGVQRIENKTMAVEAVSDRQMAENKAEETGEWTNRPEQLMTFKDVSKLLQVSRSTLYRMMDRGELTGLKIGQEWRFEQEDIRRLLTEARKQTEKDWQKKLNVVKFNCQKTRESANE